MEKIKALYYIKDNRTDKIIYIGQTKDFKNRKIQHFSSKVKPVDKYMFDEGRDNFEMNIFNDIDCSNLSDEEMLKKEDELIVYYDTIKSGWNKLRSGLRWDDDFWKEYRNEYFKEYRQTEEYKKHQKYYKELYYQEHKEELLEKGREYRQTEQYKETRNNYRQTEKYKESHKRRFSEYQKTDKYKEWRKQYMKEYRARKREEKMNNTK
jgi:hypothetical protein